MKFFFGAACMSDFTIHKNEDRKNKYILRKSGVDAAGFLSRWLLWNKPTNRESYQDIKKDF